MIYIFISIIIILFIIIIIQYKINNNKIQYYKNNITKLVQEEINNKKQQIETELNSLKTQRINLIEEELKNKKQKEDIKLQLFIEQNNKKIRESESTINILNKEIELKEQMLKRDRDSIDQELESYRQQKMILIEQQLENNKNNMIKEQDNYLSERKISINMDISNSERKLEEIKKELQEYLEKQTAANEAILRQKEIEEKQTFYKINLTKEEIEDIIYLKEFENKFHNKEMLQKAIYESYYKKPLMELFKRVLKNEEFSGIYKITSLKTGEIYIGRAVNIKKRWTDHIKSSMGIGTLVSSTLHKRLKEDGCWNFTFEVLEQVEKDKISERESYWIDFYQSNIYGLNIKKGDQNGIKQ